MSNQATASIVADSISPDGIRLTTFQLRYWRPIHSELMTHRVFSRNAGSSRARPSAKIIEQVRTEAWAPIHWGANQPGMQAHQELDEADIATAKFMWGHAAETASYWAEMFFKHGVHKQIVNRLLEPFTYIDVLVTATDYANFFMLRDHKDAQPEIRELAQLMKAAYDASIPQLLAEGEWHLPYITKPDWEAAHEFVFRQKHPEWVRLDEAVLDTVRKISVARCARVSYKAFDGNVAPVEKDIELFEQLLVSQPLHASPAEHQATPDQSYREKFGEMGWHNPQLHGNFRGWCQYRKMLPNEFLPG